MEPLKLCYPKEPAEVARAKRDPRREEWSKARYLKESKAQWCIWKLANPDHRCRYYWYRPCAWDRALPPPVSSLFDHVTMWKDRMGLRYVITSHPYGIDQEGLTIMKAWCQIEGVEVVIHDTLESWYWPGGTNFIEFVGRLK